MAAVAQFLTFLHSEKRFSPHTIRAYQTDLAQYQLYLSDQFHLEDLLQTETKHIRTWIMNLVDSGLSYRSINRKLTVLRRFFQFANQESWIPGNPAAQVPGLKTKKSLPHYVEEKPMRKVLQELEKPDGYKALRDLLIVELLYGTGMRLSELIHLKESDMDLRRKQIKVMGKRSKERLIPLPEPLVELIGQYLQLKHDEFPDAEFDQLILTGRGKPIYPKLVYRVVHQYLSLVSNLDRRSPHILRHTYATHLLNKGADLNAIKELLGHASLNATQVYTHVGIEKLKRVYKQAHPRA